MKRAISRFIEAALILIIGKNINIPYKFVIIIATIFVLWGFIDIFTSSNK